jgi:hypothetical protein
MVPARAFLPTQTGVMPASVNPHKASARDEVLT